MSAYIRAPKAKLKGSISEICDEDKEDFEQEQLIKQWLEREGKAGAIEFKHISRKGTARKTLDKRSLRLDKEMRDESGSGTYADIIAGSDGRDWECGVDAVDAEREAREIIHGYLFALGFNQGEIKWLIRTLKLSMDQKELLSATLASDSEW